jgi:hypothetical protein
MPTVPVAPLESLLEASKCTPEFREAVVRLSRNEAPGPLIAFSGGVPPVKGLRTISKLLEMEPQREIRQVHIQGQSGCSDFVGTLKVNGDELIVAFKWDCAWRAQQEGLVDYFGSPDQIKAAQTFGYQCFEEWNARSSAK